MAYNNPGVPAGQYYNNMNYNPSGYGAYGPPATFATPPPPQFPYQQQQQMQMVAPAFPTTTAVNKPAGFGLRELCIGLGFFLIALGIANLLGIYLWPDKFACRGAIRQTEDEIDKVIDNTYKNITGSQPRSFYKPREQGINNQCDTLTGVYTACNIISTLFSCLGGLFLLLGAVQRKSAAVILAVVALGLCLILIFIQGIPVYLFGIVRYSINVNYQMLVAVDESVENEKATEIKKPFLGLTGQHVLSVLGLILFLCLYVGFMVCAILFRQELSRQGVGVGPHQPTPHPTLRLSQPSNYFMEQQAPYNRAHNYGMVETQQAAPPQAQSRPASYGLVPPQQAQSRPASYGSVPPSEN